MKNNNFKKNLIQVLLLVTVCFVIFTVEVGTVVTGSMIPTIEINESVLYWKLYPFSKVEKGDIVVYSSTTSMPIVHRVHSLQYSFDNGKTVKNFQMKGDNNIGVDAELVTPDNYVGKVFYIVKNDKVNSLVKAFADINSLTRIGVALIVVTIWVVITELKSHKSSASSIKKERSDIKKQTQEFKGYNLEIIDLEQEGNDNEQADDNDWFNV